MRQGRASSQAQSLASGSNERGSLVIATDKQVPALTEPPVRLPVALLSDKPCLTFDAGCFVHALRQSRHGRRLSKQLRTIASK